ncbi:MULTISPECIES: hypothetical protein [Bacillota]|uniref:hypothetical protein n=1 Tax=Bacillota TaxID=1239 RepID=UPI0039EDF31D
MNSALLHSGKVISAAEYNVDVHGHRIFCIDKSCRAPVIYVAGTETSVPYFKTTGKNDDSKHTISCGFYKPLTFEESIQKVGEYQAELSDQGIKETVIRINLNKIDPDYEAKQVERNEQEPKEKNPNEVKIKQDKAAPNSISSLKSVVKLLTSYEPDTLASILVNVKGKKIPLSHIIISYEKAHELLWSGQAVEGLSYFVYGTIEQVYRREKVYYINFKPINNVLFSLVIFDRYFKHFTYSDEQLIGKKVLAWGPLRQNSFKDQKNTSEIIIKSNKYIEFIK